MDVCFLYDWLEGEWWLLILKILRFLEQISLLIEKENNIYFFQTISIKLGEGQTKIFLLICLACFDAYQKQHMERHRCRIKREEEILMLLLEGNVHIVDFEQTQQSCWLMQGWCVFGWQPQVWEWDLSTQLAWSIPKTTAGRADLRASAHPSDVAATCAQPCQHPIRQTFH